MITAIVTKKEDLVQGVINDYMMNEVELSSAYFDFEVDMPAADVLSAYAEIQETINGDIVTFPEGVTGYVQGNCMNYLVSLNGKEGFVRTMDTGEVLDFVF